MPRRLTRNMGKTAGASMVQFLLTLITTPLMTRLFQPESYATFGILNSWAAVMVGIGMLSLPNAYCAQKDARERHALLKVMVALVLVTALLALLGVSVLQWKESWQRVVSVSGAVLWLLPLLVLTYGARQILVNMAIQAAEFGRLSLGQMVEPLCSRGGSVTMGAVLGGNPAWIILSVMFGHLSMLFTLRRLLPAKMAPRVRALVAFLPQVWPTLRRFADFVWFNTASQQAQPLVMLGLQMGVAFWFGGHMAGQYILAVSMLTLPVSLIALATAPVVYHHFIELARETPARLTVHVLLLLMLYLVAGALLYAPVYVWGEPLFSFAFGALWSEAGRIAATLSLAFVASFALTAVQSVLMVTRRLRLQFLAELITAACVLLAALLCFRAMAFEQAIFYLSIIWLSRNVVLLAVSLMAAWQHPRCVESHG